MRRRAAARVTGMVQGVGFRPFVAGLARRFGLTGWVRNDGGAVTLEASGDEGALRAFFAALREHPPREARIETLDIVWKGRDPSADAAGRPGFVILPSGRGSVSRAMPAPDIAVCPACLAEMHAPGGPRYRNPFLSCTLCGPRYSILESLPYDRENTAMAEFPLCSRCETDYADPGDRRCHAQTICCNDCGPTLFYRATGSRASGGAGASDRAAAAGPSKLAAPDAPDAAGESALRRAADALLAGGVVAVKGIGGYHLACSPFNPAAVACLREIKARESKPFAVMFPTPDSLRPYAVLTSAAEALLSSRARPIVLLTRASPPAGLPPLAPGVAGTSFRLGAFLPCAPLQTLLLELTGPLVMTSANRTSLPLIKDEDEIFALAAQADGRLSGVLYHNRRIVRRLDDSVTDVAEEQPRILRRARGYVPLPLERERESAFLPGGEGLLAFGPQQKNTLCLTDGRRFFPSTEIGDLDTGEALAVFRRTAAELPPLLRLRPARAACDLHPGYESTRLARESGLPLVPVQHHAAHIASVLAEHGLDPAREGGVLGVALDGTGYGTDGTVWGSEFLLFSSAGGWERAGHLRPVSLFGSDKAVRNGETTARCLLLQAGAELPGDPAAPLVRAALAAGVHTVRSSGIGRWFDGVSAALGLCRVSDYEGRCAIELENAAAAWKSAHPAPPPPFEFALTREPDGRVTADFLPVIRAAWEDFRSGEPAGRLAWRFHRTVCRWLVETCRVIGGERGVRKAALSGGVFANRLLLDEVLPALRDAGFAVYYNREVPPGDGGISTGQAWLALNAPEKGRPSGQATNA